MGDLQARRIILKNGEAYHLPSLTGEILIVPIIGDCECRLTYGSVLLHAHRARVNDEKRHPDIFRAVLLKDDACSLHGHNGIADVLLYIKYGKPDEREHASVASVLSSHPSWHGIGEGTHERQVWHYDRPEGYTIDYGETLNVAGGWSSWPAHATPEEARTRYTEHCEWFFLVTPGPYALMHCDGYYTDGKPVLGVQECHNGDLMHVPLGAHEIVAAPGHWLWYAWAYVSFLQKTYNAVATDVGVYIR